MNSVFQVPLTSDELNTRINLNYQRLTENFYQIENIFQDSQYDWPGDKEGRALLAFVCLYKLTGKRIPAMDQMLIDMSEHIEPYGYLGPQIKCPIFEQQLSGHNWMLRGLCEAYLSFGNKEYLEYAKRIVYQLYLPTISFYSTYPIEREYNMGGVDGNSGLIIDQWNLSTDIGCAFMSLDGLSQYYEITHDTNAFLLLEEMISVYESIDFLKLEAQTHCTLTAARGLLRLFNCTKNKKYLDISEKIWRLYTQNGMTYTYQNFNWWGKGDTWTEPCAIVDSLILSLQLWEIKKDKTYLTMARKIWHNGMAFSQRPNGGAGTDSTVSSTNSIYKALMYEAYNCCTMRFSEGLLYAKSFKRELTAEKNGVIRKDGYGRYMDGDILYGQIIAGQYDELEEMKSVKYVDGLALIPIVKLYRVKQSAWDKIEIKIVF